ncbi:uncharacterized protein PGTG_13599 [Puccinia graminis f. sp. tritici CRL 75-36-700-3]|uniref:Uncharacterized protein n=1 Tax=Puccinia graminis f. sp. tritici (strain CRL 75-36-700-3 / race SCCL) TaxID=418459 RepID=E3KSY5_PUCGT|nr:uncharacterized protein PGTG_13599 [Puccinia graminis f. sp. tritici CRL 75-36-700-3]EFP87371.1 hypothetical protein PGTG_13599 [Puccinia graminis f. sp. tritici CRL 75-36-700-3]
MLTQILEGRAPACNFVQIRPTPAEQRWGVGLNTVALGTSTCFLAAKVLWLSCWPSVVLSISKFRKTSMVCQEAWLSSCACGLTNCELRNYDWKEASWPKRYKKSGRPIFLKITVTYVLTVKGRYHLWKNYTVSKQEVCDLINQYLINNGSESHLWCGIKQQVTTLEKQFCEALVGQEKTGQGIVDDANDLAQQAGGKLKDDDFIAVPLDTHEQGEDKDKLVCPNAETEIRQSSIRCLFVGPMFYNS